MSSFVDFSSFGITPDIIIGDKIPISDILNKEIYIYKVKIDKSKFENRNSSGLRMHLQIKINNENGFRSFFTGSDTLIGMMKEAMGSDKFCYPIKTTIIKSGKIFIFT